MSVWAPWTARLGLKPLAAFWRPRYNHVMARKKTTALLAALWLCSPAGAQNRVGVVSEASLNVSGAPAPTVLSGPTAFNSAPLSASGLTATLPAASVPTLQLSQPSVVTATALTPATALKPAAFKATMPASSKPEGLHQLAHAEEALDVLSPASIGKISGEQAKGLSGRLLGEDSGVGGVPSALAVSGSWAASKSDLDPASEKKLVAANAPAAPLAPPVAPSWNDRWHHWRLLAQNYYWYSVTHIVNMWPAYKVKYEEAKLRGAANVSRPREFFAFMRIAAISGRFYVLGAAPLEDDQVISEMRKTLIKWFDAPGVIGPKELAAFDAFTTRARHYNEERRAPSNMRKHIRDAILKAATMEPAKIAPFFDSLLVAETAVETADFQNKGAQKRILDAFKEVVRQTLAEEPAGAKGAVKAAILLGSFATGSAGPKSDFDVELLVDGGSNARSPYFIKRLTDRWIATGYHATNPVTVHDFPSTPSRGIIDLVHSGDYILISLDDALTEKLQRKPGEYAPKMIRQDSFKGAANRAVQYGLIIASTYLGELKARFGAASGSGH